MARAAINDVLLNYPFWLMDVAPIELFGIPVLSPEFGFSAITAPEMTLNMEEIVEGNWHFPRKVVKDGSIGSISLSRGATFADSEFYRWARVALTGNTENYQSEGYNTAMMLRKNPQSGWGIAATAVGGIAGLFGVPRIGGPSPRRDLVLIQFFAHGPMKRAHQEAFAGLSGMAFAAAQGPTTFVSGVAGVGLSELEAIGTPGKLTRIPARAWKLRGCIPMRYKAGTDFDASGVSVSIMELDLEVESMAELSLSTI